MSYTNCISLTTALKLDLFDDIKYIHLKDLLTKSMDWDEYDFEVKIEDLPNEYKKIGYDRRTKFTFTLGYTEFEKIYLYGAGSVRAFQIDELWEEEI